jgi:hypothetical protein
VTMRVALTTELDVSPDALWEAVLRTDTLRYVARGLIGFRTGELPELWATGQQVTARLMLFHVLPLWRHTLVVRRVDRAERVIESEERGGPIRRWDHRVVVAADGGGARYTDIIDLEAGALTTFIWLFARLFYRHRQRRWRGLASRLRTAQLNVRA